MMRTVLFITVVFVSSATLVANALIANSGAVTTKPIITTKSGCPKVPPIEQQEQNKEDASSSSSVCNRRSFFGGSTTSAAAVALLLSTGVVAVQPCDAFPNKISDKYDDRPKQRGSPPKDLGIAKRVDVIEDEEYVGLSICGPKPNCFSSTDRNDGYHSIPSWKWPTTDGIDSVEAAFVQLEQVLKEYKPGQNNIDGGGFQIVKSDPKAGYLYVQFQALKNGYIDDFELAYIKDTDSSTSNSNSNAVQIRSSSRLGYLDYGVNAKRINYIAAKLREKKWDAPGVDFSTHQSYASQNGI